jgi:fructose-1,6-bisphosphatase
MAALASEEEDGVVEINPVGGKYVVVYDPLDGSSVRSPT